MRRSTQERTQTEHPDAEYFRTLEVERQAHSATLSESHYASFDACVQAENTYQAFEEAQHQQMLLCANVEKLCSYTESMDTFHCLMASLGEKPNTAHMNLAHVLAVKATKDTP